jgi:hypothetical protein
MGEYAIEALSLNLQPFPTSRVPRLVPPPLLRTASELLGFPGRQMQMLYWGVK